jgi:hypothetical protein
LAAFQQWRVDLLQRIETHLPGAYRWVTCVLSRLDCSRFCVMM